MLSLVQIESSASASASTAHSTGASHSHSPHNNASSSKMQAPARPARAIPRTYPAVPLADTDEAVLYERSSSTKGFDASDLEMSRPVTPVEDKDADDDDDNDDNDNNNDRRSSQSRRPGDLGSDNEGDGVEVEVLQSMFSPRKNAFRMATVGLNTLNDGLNDSAAGALLPYIERHYNIGYGIVSLIFVSCAMGSIMAATVVDPMKRRLGRARTTCAAQLIMALGYVPVITTLAPFPAVVVGFFLVGLGAAINIAMGNTFCVGLRQGTLSLGIMHGSYGIGGISGPLIATAIAVSTGAAEHPDDKSATVFGRYYLLPFSVCILTAVLSAWSFTGYEKDWGEIREVPGTPLSTSTDSGERRRRWRIGRQRQAELDQQQAQPQLQTSALAAPAAGIQLTDFASSPTTLQRPRPVSQPSTAPSSRVGSRAPSPSPSPTREAMPSARPVLSMIQSHPQTQSPSPSAFASAQPTPMHSFASSTAPLFAPADRPAVVTMAAPPRSRRNRYRERTRTQAQRAKDRLKDMFTAPSSRIILLGAMFLFMYQGAEVSVAGWVTSFLIADRGGKEPAVGYITAGFWAGITLGRFCLAWPAQRVGVRIFVYGLVAGSAIFELLVWFVPNVIGDAVAVSIVGLLLGPVYPCAAGLLMRGMSRRERVSGMSAMAAFGSAGGAAAPFITGVLAQAVGTFVLHPVVIGLFAAMAVFWYFVPAERKPQE
ncbi:hypothetical protein SCUCBS95973_001131 [Sporothrix curviconia]|uniref:Major facilitator superfamily (MFS) profile domain-containing protein n=1 Tax=Sporothrix curviconia TaxID=1260050 RepID=A0ABP0AWH5_9PEZI